MDAAFVDAWRAICQVLEPSFSGRSFATFLQLATGWALCRSKPTVTNLVCTIGGSLLGHAAKHWTVYERFFYRTAWSLDEVSRHLMARIVLRLIDRFGSDGRDAPIEFVMDGTTCGRRGKHVAFAGYYKDASVTNVTQAVVHWAHHWLIGAIVIRPARWPRWAMALPVTFSLHRKPSDCDRDHPFLTINQQAARMIDQVRKALPGRRIRVVADGAFASREVVAALDESTCLISRVRRDAALHAPLPKRRRRRPGRPPTRGRRLPTPEQMARRATNWKRIGIRKGGRVVQRDVVSCICLWAHVCGPRKVKILIVRDPRGQRIDEYLVCTDPSVSDTMIAERYAGRWTIEEAIQDGKQFGGFESVHGWCPRTVIRQAPMALIVQTLVKAWYVTAGHRATLHPKGAAICGWRAPKAHPSYLDMLATLRRVLWEERVNNKSWFRRLKPEIRDALAFTLSAAA